MNILYIMRYWPVYGGGETITATLANEFVRRGHNVFIAYQYNNVVNPMPYEIDSRVKIFKTHTIEKYKNKDVLSLHDYIIDNNIDVMINQWGDSSLCANAKKDTNCKLIVCWHLDVLRKADKNLGKKDKIIKQIFGNNLFEKYNRVKQLREHNRNYRLSDKYVFLSDSFVNVYKHLAKIEDKDNKLSAISNPLTYNFDYDFNDIDKKKKEVLFVGRIFEYHKRLSYILKIWSKIEKDHDFDEWTLKIVGDGPDMSLIKELSNRLQIRRITFEGFKNPRKYYNEASIFVMTSAFEGFGMTLVEAQQYATVPIVMDTYLSLHDIIINENNGVIIPDNDINMYVSKLKLLMSDDKYRLKLAYNGLSACKKFNVKNITDKWELLLNNLIK